jgi:hypothetical protein
MVYIIDLGVDYRAVMVSAALFVISGAYGIGRMHAPTPSYSDHCKPAIDAEGVCRAELDTIEQTHQTVLLKATSRAQENAMRLCEQEKAELNLQFEQLNCEICTAFIGDKK